MFVMGKGNSLEILQAQGCFSAFVAKEMEALLELTVTHPASAKKR